MKRKGLIFLTALLCTLPLGGCGNQKGAQTAGGGGSAQLTEKEIRHLTSGRHRTDGQVESYLTGEYVDERVGVRRPAAIMMNNVEAALPMYGISKAGVVYEAPVEGELTRLMGVFEDYDGLDRIGSVRSCRNYFVYYALEFDAIYAHYGQAAYALELLEKDYVDNLSGLSKVGSTVYYRTNDRKAPHNACASAEGIEKGIKMLGYRTTYRDTYNGKFHFVAQDEVPSVKDGVRAFTVSPGYPVNRPVFQYHEEDGLYYRSQYGKAQIDGLTGEQLRYKNIILQYSHWAKLDENGYLAFDCHSGGMIKYISDGKAVDGTWKRIDDGSGTNGDVGTTKYYDLNGKELLINRGKTFVCIIKDSTLDQVIVE